MQLAEEIILRKRDGRQLGASDISSFVQGISDGVVSDAQIAAFAMATWFSGMTVDEETLLTLAMRDSGQVLSWQGIDGPVLDKHSTGGVGDLVSLVLGPLLASCGAYVPMISGRGLGHTGGTLDKLESIPGFETSPGMALFQQWVRDHRISIIGQTGELAPADRRIYAVRDVTATVSSIPLIISSILSKKLAEGLDALVMDIKFGSGAFTPEPEEARKLALELVEVSRRAGLPCHALLTDMDSPLAWSAGNALEIRETIGFLRGDSCNPRLLEVVLSLAEESLCLGGLAGDLAEARRLALSALDSGQAAERFALMVAGQGGPSDLLEKAGRILPRSLVVAPVFAEHSGYVTSIDTKAVGTIVLRLGGGRLSSGSCVDPSVGISDILPVGQPADSSRPLALIHAASEADWQRAAAAYIEAVHIGEKPFEPVAVVADRVVGEGGDSNDG